MTESGVLKLRSDRIAFRQLGDEMVVLDLRTSTYLSTNASATLLWRTLEAGVTREALVAALVGKYDVDEATAAADVDEFLADCRSRDLLAD